MTISDYLGFFTSAVAVATAFYIMFGFRSLRKTNEEERGILERRIAVFELKYERLLGDAQEDLRNLQEKFDGLGCAQIGKNKETETGEDSPIKGVHVVSVRGGNFSLGDIIAQMMGGSRDKEENDTFHAYVKIRAMLENEGAKLDVAEIKTAVKKLEKDGLEALLDYLDENQFFEFSAVVRDEIGLRKTQKTKK